MMKHLLHDKKFFKFDFIETFSCMKCGLILANQHKFAVTLFSVVSQSCYKKWLTDNFLSILLFDDITCIQTLIAAADHSLTS